MLAVHHGSCWRKIAIRFIVSAFHRKERKDVADQLRARTELTEINRELQSNVETSGRISREFQVSY